MKKILFCLLLLAGFAAANTCTEAYFQSIKPYYIASQVKPHIDSIYYEQDLKETDSLVTKQKEFIKYFYNNGCLEKIVFGNINDTKIDTTQINHYYQSKDKNELSGSGSEVLFSDSTYADTTFWDIKYYFFKGLHRVEFYKETNSYKYVLTTYYKYPEKYITSRELSEFFFRNDTLVFMEISDFNPDIQQDQVFTYFVEDPDDDQKCYEYKNGTLTDTLIYNPKENGYSIRIINETGYREHFMVNPDLTTTAIRKQRPAAKISPKARYFDLLGRYRFTK